MQNTGWCRFEYFPDFVIILTFIGLVGDGLLEPFWPTGSGCARGFLGVLDTCFAMQEWSEGHKSVLQILAERESIFRLLAQTTSENLSKDFKNYAPSPNSRYFYNFLAAWSCTNVKWLKWIVKIYKNILQFNLEGLGGWNLGKLMLLKF